MKGWQIHHVAAQVVRLCAGVWCFQTAHEDAGHVFNELQKLGVIVRPMASYQLPEWIRISMGTPKQNQRCLEALKTVLGKQSTSGTIRAGLQG